MTRTPSRPPVSRVSREGEVEGDPDLALLRVWVLACVQSALPFSPMKQTQLLESIPARLAGMYLLQRLKDCNDTDN